MATSATISSQTTSSAVTLGIRGKAIIDLDVTGTITFTGTIDSRKPGGDWKAIQLPDMSDDLSVTAATSLEVASGEREYRVNLSAFTGTGTVTISISQA